MIEEILSGLKEAGSEGTGAWKNTVPESPGEHRAQDRGLDKMELRRFEPLRCLLIAKRLGPYELLDIRAG